MLKKENAHPTVIINILEENFEFPPLSRIPKVGEEFSEVAKLAITLSDKIISGDGLKELNERASAIKNAVKVLKKIKDDNSPESS